MMGRNILQAVTKIELGVQSQLLASPGQTVQIYYEVTNLREEPTFHNFQVVDEKRYLRALSPMSLVFNTFVRSNILILKSHICLVCGWLLVKLNPLLSRFTYRQTHKSETRIKLHSLPKA